MKTQQQGFYTSRSEKSYKNTSLFTNSFKDQTLDPESEQLNHQMYNKTTLRNTQSFINLVEVASTSFQDKLCELIQSSSYNKAQVYGYSIQKLKNQLKQQKKSGLGYVWACYNSLNWQGLSIAVLKQYINTFPTQQDIIQNIRVQNNQIKIDKLDKTLNFSILNKEWSAEDKKHKLNRFANRQYERSLTKISFDIQSYQFNGLIRQIQSNEFLVAIRTDTSIYTINPINQMKRFDVKSRDIKLNGCRLFFIEVQGSVGSILLQNVYIPKMNQMEIESQTLCNYQCSKDQFLINAQKYMIVGKLTLDNQFRKIQFKTFMRRQAQFQFQLDINMGEQEQVVFRESVMIGRYLFICIFTGFEGRIKNYHQIKFLIV